jgi:hypothetical protein
MSLRMTVPALALLGASAFAVNALAQAAPSAGTAPAAAPAVPAAPAPLDQKVKVFATLPTPDATENICQQADGSLYVSVIDQKKILKITPDGKVSEFASAPMMMHVLGLGCGDNEVAALFYGKTFRGTPAVAATATTPAVPAGPLHFDNTDTHIYVYDLSGKMTADIAAQKGDGFNGFAYSGTPGLYYAGNSSNGSISTVDTKAKKIATWWSDPSFGPAGTSAIGINGVRVRNGWVYMSAPTKKGLWKVQIGADGKPMGNPVKIEDAVNADDFDVAANGEVYFPAGTILYRAPASGGDPVKVADPIQGGPSLVVARDGKSVFWPTRGGTANQRVLQVATP